MTKKIIFSLIAFYAVAGCICAQQRSYAEAKRIASEYFSEELGDVNPIVTESNSRKIQLEREETYSPYYVFNSNSSNGFIIISGDERMEIVLGLSDDGNFSYEDVPDGLQCLLDAYSLEYDLLQYGMDVQAQRRGLLGIDDTPVEPMIKSSWHQYSPYNSQCVMNGKVCITGCVSTAIAQILRRWQYPAKAKGNVKYTTQTLKYNISENLDKYSFDWSIMENEYLSGSKSQSASEVAKLMYALGVSFKTDYMTESEGGSSVKGRDIVSALVNNFGLDSSAELIEYADFEIKDWFRALVDEMHEGRPVLYMGTKDNYNHAFLVDGMKEGPLFHINWGWKSMSGSLVSSSTYNGYYNLLSSSFSFPDSQQMVRYICPPGQIEEARTGIETVSADSGTLSQDDNYYDLMGRVVKNPERGIFIKNGKKIKL